MSAAGFNWSRGFFRIWLALSIVYIGLVLCFQDYSKIANIWTPPNPKFSIEFSSGKFTADYSKASNVVYADITEALKNEARTLQQQGKQKEAAEITNDLIHRTDDIFDTLNTQTALIRSESKREGFLAIARSVGITIGPPLAVLMLGLLLRWIGRGFSRKPAL